MTRRSQYGHLGWAVANAGTALVFQVWEPFNFTIAAVSTWNLVVAVALVTTVFTVPEGEF